MLPLPQLALLASLAAATPVNLGDLVNSFTDDITLDDVRQGILPDFLNWDWSVDQIEESLGIDANALDDVETKVLTLPGYANYTDRGWTLRFHAQAYKEPLSENSPITNETLDNAVNGFLPDLDIGDLAQDEQANARNLTSAILSIPQSGVGIAFDLSFPPNSDFTSSWRARIVWPLETSTFGEVDGFVPLPSRSPSELPDGTNEPGIVRLDVHTNVSSTGNSSAYLVPTTGVTVVSDIDDVLRVTKIWQPQEGLLNTFARDFQPWRNMPQVYAAWSDQHPEEEYHFHYLTTTPQPATRVYEQFVFTHYPLGSFDTRPYNFTNLEATLSIREHLLRKIIETFPERRFVLVGDTSNSDTLRDYPTMVRDYDNVRCVLIRNTSATEEMRLPYNTGEFATLPRDRYMFFNTPDDLLGLNLGDGDCRNGSVPQNTEFGWHLGTTVFDQGNTAGRHFPGAWLALVVALVGLLVM